MARMPMATPPPAASAGMAGGGAGGAGGLGGGAGATDPTDPTGGAGGDAGDDGSNVVCTIVDNGDGTYTVYAGDEPDAGDMSADDAGAMPGGGGAASQGTPADSIGAALKAALTILNANASSAGAPGSSEDQFTAGFAGGQAPPTPAGTGAGGSGAAARGAAAQKY